MNNNNYLASEDVFEGKIIVSNGPTGYGTTSQPDDTVLTKQKSDINKNAIIQDTTSSSEYAVDITDSSLALATTGFVRDLLGSGFGSNVSYAHYDISSSENISTQLVYSEEGSSNNSTGNVKFTQISNSINGLNLDLANSSSFIFNEIGTYQLFFQCNNILSYYFPPYFTGNGRSLTTSIASCNYQFNIINSYYSPEIINAELQGQAYNNSSSNQLLKIPLSMTSIFDVTTTNTIVDISYNLQTSMTYNSSNGTSTTTASLNSGQLYIVKMSSGGTGSTTISDSELDLDTSANIVFTDGTTLYEYGQSGHPIMTIDTNSNLNVNAIMQYGSSEYAPDITDSSLKFATTKFVKDIVYSNTTNVINTANLTTISDEKEEFNVVSPSFNSNSQYSGNVNTSNPCIAMYTNQFQITSDTGNILSLDSSATSSQLTMNKFSIYKVIYTPMVTFSVGPSSACTFSDNTNGATTFQYTLSTSFYSSVSSTNPIYTKSSIVYNYSTDYPTAQTYYSFDCSNNVEFYFTPISIYTTYYFTCSLTITTNYVYSGTNGLLVNNLIVDQGQPLIIEELSSGGTGSTTISDSELDLDTSANIVFTDGTTLYEYGQSGDPIMTIDTSANLNVNAIMQYGSSEYAPDITDSSLKFATTQFVKDILNSNTTNVVDTFTFDTNGIVVGSVIPDVNTYYTPVLLKNQFNNTTYDIIELADNTNFSFTNISNYKITFTPSIQFSSEASPFYSNEAYFITISVALYQASSGINDVGTTITNTTLLYETVFSDTCYITPETNATISNNNFEYYLTTESPSYYYYFITTSYINNRNGSGTIVITQLPNQPLIIEELSNNSGTGSVSISDSALDTSANIVFTDGTTLYEYGQSGHPIMTIDTNSNINVNTIMQYGSSEYAPDITDSSLKFATTQFVKDILNSNTTNVVETISLYTTEYKCDSYLYLLYSDDPVSSLSFTNQFNTSNPSYDIITLTDSTNFAFTNISNYKITFTPIVRWTMTGGSMPMSTSDFIYSIYTGLYQTYTTYTTNNSGGEDATLMTILLYQNSSINYNLSILSLETFSVDVSNNFEYYLTSQSPNYSYYFKTTLSISSGYGTKSNPITVTQLPNQPLIIEEISSSNSGTGSTTISDSALDTSANIVFTDGTTLYEYGQSGDPIMTIDTNSNINVNTIMQYGSSEYAPDITDSSLKFATTQFVKDIVYSNTNNVVDTVYLYTTDFEYIGFVSATNNASYISPALPNEFSIISNPNNIITIESSENITFNKLSYYKVNFVPVIKFQCVYAGGDHSSYTYDVCSFTITTSFYSSETPSIPLLQTSRTSSYTDTYFSNFIFDCSNNFEYYLTTASPNYYYYFETNIEISIQIGGSSSSDNSDIRGFQFSQIADQPLIIEELSSGGTGSTSISDSALALDTSANIVFTDGKTLYEYGSNGDPIMTIDTSANLNVNAIMQYGSSEYAPDTNDSSLKFATTQFVQDLLGSGVSYAQFVVSNSDQSITVDNDNSKYSNGISYNTSTFTLEFTADNNSIDGLSLDSNSTFVFNEIGTYQVIFQCNNTLSYNCYATATSSCNYQLIPTTGSLPSPLYYSISGEGENTGYYKLKQTQNIPLLMTYIFEVTPSNNTFKIDCTLYAGDNYQTYDTTNPDSATASFNNGEIYIVKLSSGGTGSTTISTNPLDTSANIVFTDGKTLYEYGPNGDPIMTIDTSANLNVNAIMQYGSSEYAPDTNDSSLRLATTQFVKDLISGGGIGDGTVQIAYYTFTFATDMNYQTGSCTISGGYPIITEIYNNCSFININPKQDNYSYNPVSPSLFTMKMIITKPGTYLVYIEGLYNSGSSYQIIQNGITVNKGIGSSYLGTIPCTAIITVDDTPNSGAISFTGLVQGNFYFYPLSQSGSGNGSVSISDSALDTSANIVFTDGTTLYEYGPNGDPIMTIDTSANLNVNAIMQYGSSEYAPDATDSSLKFATTQFVKDILNSNTPYVVDTFTFDTMNVSPSELSPIYIDNNTYPLLPYKNQFNNTSNDTITLNDTNFVFTNVSSYKITFTPTFQFVGKSGYSGSVTCKINIALYESYSYLNADGVTIYPNTMLYQTSTEQNYLSVVQNPPGVYGAPSYLDSNVIINNFEYYLTNASPSYSYYFVTNITLYSKLQITLSITQLSTPSLIIEELSSGGTGSTSISDSALALDTSANIVFTDGKTLYEYGPNGDPIMNIDTSANLNVNAIMQYGSSEYAPDATDSSLKFATTKFTTEFVNNQIQSTSYMGPIPSSKLVFSSNSKLTLQLYTYYNITVSGTSNSPWPGISMDSATLPSNPNAGDWIHVISNNAGITFDYSTDVTESGEATYVLNFTKSDKSVITHLSGGITVANIGIFVVYVNSTYGWCFF